MMEIYTKCFSFPVYHQRHFFFADCCNVHTIDYKHCFPAENIGVKAEMVLSHIESPMQQYFAGEGTGKVWMVINN